jgi:hypothetical protein
MPTAATAMTSTPQGPLSVSSPDRVVGFVAVLPREMPSSSSPMTITTPVPQTSAARMIFYSSCRLISAVAIGLILVCSGVRRRRLPERRDRGLRCDGRAVKLVGRDLGALRELAQHDRPRGSDQRDHDRAGGATAEQI